MEQLFKKGDQVALKCNHFINSDSGKEFKFSPSQPAIILGRIAGVDELNPECIIVEFGADYEYLRVFKPDDLIYIIKPLDFKK